MMSPHEKWNEVIDAEVRSTLASILGRPDDPEAERVTVEVAPEDPGTLLVNWPESMHSADVRTNVRDAVKAALPPEFRYMKVTIT